MPVLRDAVAGDPAAGDAWHVLYGYAPVLTYTYTVNHSNVGFHEYSAHGINFTVTKNF